MRRDLLGRIGQLNSLPYLDDDAWLRLTMANAGEMVLVSGVGRVPLEGAVVLRREATEGEVAACAKIRSILEDLLVP